MTIAPDRTALHRALAAVTLVAVATVTVSIVRGEPELALVGDSGAALAVELAAAALVLAAALATWRVGVVFPVLLSAAALAWLAAEWNTPGAGAAFTAGLILYAAWPPLLATAALRGLDERPFDRPAAFVVVVAAAAGVGVLGLASTAVFDPARLGVPAVSRQPAVIADAPGLGRTLARTGLALTAAWAAAFAVLATIRIVRASPARRRWSAPVLVPAVVAVGLFGADALHGLDRGFVSNDPTDRALRLAEAGALALVAAGVALARWRTRRTRAALARLVLDIGAAPAPGELRSWLAESLGDPSLELLHRLDSGEWIDAEGRPTGLPTAPDRETTRVRAGGEDVLAVVHRPGLLDDPALLSELVTTARLALEHEALHAARRARLEELRASRARLVAAADAKRRELERDLHDGAQQRLVALALSIRLARRGIAAEDRAAGGPARRGRGGGARGGGTAARGRPWPVPGRPGGRGAPRRARRAVGADSAAGAAEPARPSLPGQRGVGRVLRRTRIAPVHRGRRDGGRRRRGRPPAAHDRRRSRLSTPR